MFTLYKLTFSNNKSYIGQTVRKIITRITQHRQSARNDSQLAVHCAWRKYGEPNCEVIGHYNNADELHIAEIKAIKVLNTLSPNGYNVCFGGETAPSKNKEVALKISKKSKGRLHKKEAITLISDASKKNWGDESYRKKVYDGVMASWTDEARAKRSDLFKEIWKKRKEDGWVMPESQKEKLRNKVFSEETRIKMSLAAKGKPKAPRTQETRNKLSEAAKEKWRNKEHSEKRIIAMKEAMNKLSEARQLLHPKKVKIEKVSAKMK